MVVEIKLQMSTPKNGEVISHIYPVYYYVVYLLCIYLRYDPGSVRNDGGQRGNDTIWTPATAPPSSLSRSVRTADQPLLIKMHGSLGAHH